MKAVTQLSAWTMVALISIAPGCKKQKAAQPAAAKPHDAAGASPGPATGATHAAPAVLDTAAIEKLTGARGSFDPHHTAFKVTVPRTDLKVVADGVPITPRMGLTSWAAFEPAGSQVMVMGDIVVTEEAIGPTMSAALNNGLQVTALHNHFLWVKPMVMFMHIGGRGDQAKLAGAVGKVFRAMKAKHQHKPPHPAIDPHKTSLDTAALDAALGLKGSFKNGVYKVAVPRTVTMDQVQAGGPMGVSTWAAFTGSDSHALVDGDFAVHEDELNPVLLALRRADIEVVAIHQHMINEQPRMMFLHYWGVGPAPKLAKALKSAIDLARAP